jgi:acyl-CoA reductase-like NAD-dependent aldehyde dehydrogenase
MPEQFDARSRSYRSWIGDKDVDGVGWVYTVSSRALLEDVFTGVSLKRQLERDPDAGAVHHPYVVGRCAVAGPADIDAAVEAAAGAAPAWSATALERRLEFGRRLRERVVEHWDEFLDLLVAEAHPRTVAAWELSCLLRILSEENLAWYAGQLVSHFTYGSRRLTVRRLPDGVVVVNPPQNAPAPSAAVALLSVIAGNTVVVRAPRSIALSTMYFIRELVAPVLADLDAPPGTVNVICGKPAEVLDRWLDHPLVDDVFYFGGTEEGLRLQRECVERGKKPVLELAGNDGLVVWKDADLANAAEAITESFLGSGQICMVPNYVIAHPAIADELMRLVCRQADRIRPGFPEDEGVLLAPVRRSERFFALLDEARAAGATLVCGGSRTEVDGTPSPTGVFLQPTVLRVDGLAGARRLEVVRHETFFPLLPVIVPAPAESDADLLDAVLTFVNDNEYGLRNSLWSGSGEVIDAFVTRVHNGGLLKVNDSHIGFLPYLPTHGGTGLTGGAFGEANYPVLSTTHVQGVSVASGVRPREAAFGR